MLLKLTYRKTRVHFNML